MSDFRSTNDDALPIPSLQTPQTHQRRDISRTMSSEDPTGGQSVSEERAASDQASIDHRSGDGDSPASAQDGTPPTVHDPALMKRVSDVLSSEQGIPTLLNRLKQSIASAKEFASFLKKRGTLEDDYAQSLKKLCRSTQESMRRPEHRQGSFAQVYEEMMAVHDRMAENTVQFAASLQQMQEELFELANNAERSRKVWKANGMAAEQKVVDLEQAMRKSKAKYDSLAEEYDRARTGEVKAGGGKVLGAFKAHKSAAQHEEELLKKVQTADQTYHSHVISLQTEKSQLQSTTRPEAVKALQEVVTEIDCGLTMQMQKFASNNENLLLGNGLIISPFKSSAILTSYPTRSMRQAVASIDNERDLNEFVAAHITKVQPNTGEIKYERNPVLNPQPSSFSQSQASSSQASSSHNPPPSSFNPSQASSSHNPQSSISKGPPQGGYPPQQPLSMGSRTSTSNFGPPPGGMPPPMAQNIPPTTSEPPRSFHQQSHSRSFSQGNILNQPGPSQQPQQQPYGPRGATPSGSRYGNGGSISSGAPQLGVLPFQDNKQPVLRNSPQQPGPPFQPPQGTSAPPAYSPPSHTPPNHTPPSHGPPSHGPPSHGPPSHGPPSHGPPALLPTSSQFNFGMHLARLYEREGLAVPVVVYQCIQAVDLFGLGVEGIYRQSGSMNHINRLKAMFDSESTYKEIDFRNPENFFHDVNSVTGLLKQFLRDLPDPLLTREHHSSFITAAKHEDDVLRRDSLHAIINSLPDPNYATLRALMLHLHRVMDNSHVNRMNSHNLAVILGPTLMGTDPSTAISDAGWQIKVIDTILMNTYQIFDED